MVQSKRLILYASCMELFVPEGMHPSACIHEMLFLNFKHDDDEMGSAIFVLFQIGTLWTRMDFVFGGLRATLLPIP